jgi:hypothetical protein
MKKPSENLFQLIKSLTTSEKGYFIKFASQHVIGEKNKYLKLFDFINKQKIYDENEIRQNFKKEKFVNQLTSAKNYLTRMILRSLENYHRSDSVDTQITILINQYKILFKKTLFIQAESTLSRAKKLSTETERFTKLIEILKEERNFHYKKIGNPDFQDLLQNCYKEELEVLDVLKNIAEYNNLYLRISSLFKKIGISRNRNDVKKFKEIVSNDIMSSEKRALSIRAKDFFYIINYLYHYCTGNIEKAFHSGQKRLELIEHHGNKLSGARKEYMYALSDAIAFAYNLNKFKLCLDYLKKQREMAIQLKNDSSISNHMDMYFKSYSFELNIYLLSGYFNEGLIIVNDVIKWLEKYKGKINKDEEIKVYYAISYMYFGAGLFSDSLQWVNKILNDNSDYRQDYKIFAKIMNLIIHYELGNLDLLEYNIKSVLRYIMKKDKLYKYEFALINFIKKIIMLTGSDDLNFEYIKLKKELDKISEDDYEKKAFDYLDISSWLESKQNNIPFSEIVRKKANVKLDDLRSV